MKTIRRLYANSSRLIHAFSEYCRKIRIALTQTTSTIWEPTINQGLVRFLHPSSNASDEDHDRWTDEVIAEIVAAGEAFFGGTTWRGQRAMRVSVCNWRTSDEDIERSIKSVADVLKRKRERES